MDFTNLHPPLSAYPVALITTSFLFEVWFFFSGRLWLRTVVGANLFLGCLFTLGAFLSGYQASEFASQTFKVADETISAHHTVGKVLLFLTIPTLALYFATIKAEFNRKFFEWSFRIFLIAMTVMVFYTGYLGGQLVFAHGAGVRAELPQPTANLVTKDIP